MSGPEHSKQAAFHQFGQPFGRADAGAEEGEVEVGQGRAPRHDRYLPVEPPMQEVTEASQDAAGQLEGQNRKTVETEPVDRTGTLTDLEREASAWEAGLPDEEFPRDRNDPIVP